MAAPAGELAKHDRHDVRVGARGAHETVDVGVEPGDGRGRPRDRLPGVVGEATEAVAQHFAVETDLAREVVVDHRLVDARLGGDAIDARAGEPAGGELGPGGGEHLGARVTAAGFRRARHARAA